MRNTTIKTFLKQSKRMIQYVIAISAISIMLPISVVFFFRNSMGTASQILFGFMLLLMCTVCFIEANTIGNREQRLASVYKPFKLKGFLYGMVAQLPVWIVTFLLLIFRDAFFGPPLSEEAIGYIVNFFALQFTDIMLLFDYSAFGYILSILILPLVSCAGYLLSYYKIDIDDKLGGIHKT